jgi:capsular exopolysaccharide synthesis family protein
MTFKPTRDRLTEGVPLAMIIERQMLATPEIVMLSQPRSVYAEKFRRLKATLTHQYGEETKVIVVTSGIPGEGKSTISANLALVFAAEGGAKTLLVEGDLRRPTIASLLDPPPQLGLTEVLTGQTELVHAVLRLNNSPLKVLPAGSPAAEPGELLTSPEAADLFSTLREQYDRIIVDTPPVIPFTDADALGALSDGVILVARAGVTPKTAYTQEVSTVTSTRILGTVFNGTVASLAEGKPYYDDYYHAYYDEDRREK